MIKKGENIQTEKSEPVIEQDEFDILDTDAFLADMKYENSMIEIWDLWEDYGLGETYEEANQFIRKYKNREHLFGKLNEKKLAEVKKEIRRLMDTA